jgi:hypothetical protein
MSEVSCWKFSADVQNVVICNNWLTKLKVMGRTVGSSECSMNFLIFKCFMDFT